VTTNRDAVDTTCEVVISTAGLPDLSKGKRIALARTAVAGRVLVERAASGPSRATAASLRVVRSCQPVASRVALAAGPRRDGAAGVCASTARATLRTGQVFQLLKLYVRLHTNRTSFGN
jgi:hypothetical protein